MICTHGKILRSLGTKSQLQVKMRKRGFLFLKLLFLKTINRIFQAVGMMASKLEGPFEINSHTSGESRNKSTRK